MQKFKIGDKVIVDNLHFKQPQRDWAVYLKISAALRAKNEVNV